MWAWFLSPIGRKVALGVGLVLALFVALKWYEAKIRADEQAKQADKQSQEIEKMRAADRAATQEILNEATAKQEAAERRMQASLDREAGLVRTIVSLSQQRAVVAGEVSRVSDSELHAYNVRNIALRPEGATGTQCYLPTEERAIATALTQYPLCQKQVEATNAQVVEIKEQVAALTEKTEAMEVKFDALQGYTSRLEGYYTTVFNLVPRKRRGWKCLGLWACSRAKPLPVPDPLSLKQGATK